MKEKALFSRVKEFESVRKAREPCKNSYVIFGINDYKWYLVETNHKVDELKF